MAKMLQTHSRAASNRWGSAYRSFVPSYSSATAIHTCVLSAQMEEVKRKEMQLYQLKKKIAENDSRLKQQQVYSGQSTCMQYDINKSCIYS